MGGIVSPVSQFVGGFLINEWKNVMDAHRSRAVKMDGFERFSNITHIV